MANIPRKYKKGITIKPEVFFLGLHNYCAFDKTEQLTIGLMTSAWAKCLGAVHVPQKSLLPNSKHWCVISPFSSKMWHPIMYSTFVETSSRTNRRERVSEFVRDTSMFGHPCKLADQSSCPNQCTKELTFSLGRACCDGANSTSTYFRMHWHIANFFCGVSKQFTILTHRRQL